MAGTNIATCKRALIEQITPLLTGPDLSVSYAFPGRSVGREVVYSGRSVFGHDPAAMRRGGRLKREERGQMALHILVMIPGGDADIPTAEARAVELGTVIEDYVAANPTLGGVEGLMLATVAEGELTSGVDDEAAYAELDYQISFHSMLT